MIRVILILIRIISKESILNMRIIYTCTSIENAGPTLSNYFPPSRARADCSLVLLKLQIPIYRWPIESKWQKLQLRLFLIQDEDHKRIEKAAVLHACVFKLIIHTKAKVAIFADGFCSHLTF